MFRPSTRRDFLRSAALGGACAGLGDLSFLAGLRPVSAAEAQPDPKIVQLNPDIEPLVRLLEETDRAQLFQKVAERIRQGTTYKEVVAALQLAGVRNVQPRPAVGFKFHAVLVVNSAHLASLNSPDEHRWLPIFWALDQFKDAQARDVKEGNWTMPPVDEAAVPTKENAKPMFIEAMDNWDEAKADAAVAGLVRTAELQEIFELFCRYGARDYRAIGHKAIFVANSWRCLQLIGWQHAEPIMRSLAYALLNHEGTNDNPAKSDLVQDRPWRENLKRAEKIHKEWTAGKIDERATKDLLATLRTGSNADTCEQVVELLNKGIDPQSIWDGLFLSAGELLMRQPGIVGLHTLTTSNALRFAFETSKQDETRRMLLLQNAAFLPMFRQAMKDRGAVETVKIDELEPAELPQEGEVEKIFSTIGSDKQTAARLTLAYARQHPDPAEFMKAARLLVFMKGRDAHDYKFSSAVLEDYGHVSVPFRDRFLAAGAYNLPSSKSGDNPLVDRCRKALSG